jgi:hypothetical protein
MFKKGNPGRPKGIKNSESTSSLKKLLHDAFIRNQSAAVAKIDKMFQGEDMTDFKFMLQLKASFEPKEVEHSGSFTLNYGHRQPIQPVQVDPKKIIEHDPNE